MKNSILILIAIFYFSIIGFSQTSFGVKGGITFNNLLMDDNKVDDTQMKLGVTGGLFIQAEILQWFSVRPEVLFSVKGGKYDLGNISVNAQSNYIDIPIAGVIKIFDSQISIHAGPQLSFLSNAKYEYKGGVFGNDIVTDTSKENYHKFDLGGFVGLGYNKDKLLIELRLTRGLGKIENDRTVLSQVFEANKAQHFGVQATAGLIF